MKFRKAKNFSDIEFYISDENREEMFDDALDAIAAAIEKGEFEAKLISFEIEGEDDEFIFDIEKPEWGTVLNNAIEFYENAENYEKCAIVKQILERHEHSEKKL